MPSETILIVDDNPLNLKLARVVLAQQGFNVQTAADAEEAEESIAAACPRLILMDLQLPGMNGFDLTRKLKSDPRTRAIIVVALTAYAMKGDLERALEAGCDGYIAKPIDTRALAKQVQDYIDKSPAS